MSLDLDDLNTSSMDKDLQDFLVVEQQKAHFQQQVHTFATILIISLYNGVNDWTDPPIEWDLLG